MAAALSRLWLHSGCRTTLSAARQLANICRALPAMQFTCPPAAAAVLPLNPAGRRAEPLLGRLPARLSCSHTAIGAPWLGSGRRGHAAAAVAAAGVPPAAAAAAAAPSAAQVSPPAAPSGAALTHFTSLYIRDFALVQEQRLHLAPGLTAITGERWHKEGAAPVRVFSGLRSNCSFKLLKPVCESSSAVTCCTPRRRVGLRQVCACGSAGPSAGRRRL